MEKFNKIKDQLHFVKYSLPIQSNKKEIWEALQKFGEIASFHDNVVSSDYLNNNKFQVGCERYCEFHPQMGKKPVVKERIIDIQEGKSYLIDFYDFKNFPMNYMYIQLELGLGIEKENVIIARCWYQSKPKLLTKLFSKKMKTTLREILLGYKHFIETGKKNVKMEELKKMYLKL